MSDNTLLTEAERVDLASNLRWHFACHAVDPEKSYDSLGIENATLRVESILAARTAALQAEVVDYKADYEEWLHRATTAEAALARVRALAHTWTHEPGCDPTYGNCCPTGQLLAALGGDDDAN